MDNIPMYGQPEVPRPEQLKRLDEEFIAQASAIGSREKASQVWWAQAEEYMQQNNLDYAMRRYNQSWLLDRREKPGTLFRRDTSNASQSACRSQNSRDG